MMGANSSLTVDTRSAGAARDTGTLPRHSALHPLQDTTVTGSAAGLLMRADDRKKKSSKLATLRKRLTRVRRQSRSHDNGRAVRELTASWTVRELHSLNDEYEASAALKELTALADAARPRANTVVDDLAALYQHKYCTDVDLVYQDTVFPAHRAVLCIRCPFFRELLARHPEYGARVPVSVRTAGVDVPLFSALLRYVYTGDFGLDDARVASMRKLLTALAHEFGAPNSLEQDLRTLLDTGAYSDAVLVFASSPPPPADVDQTAAGTPSAGGVRAFAEGGSGSGSRRSRGELRCHKAILAARSAFFRNLVARRARSGEELTERALNTPTRIVLDEQVIPRRYARALLTAIYLDVVDPACIMRSSVSLGTLSEVQAAVASRTHVTATDEAMELYHIGRFIDFPALAHGCEDIITEALTIDSLPSVLQWSCKPHGSVWVHRQAIQFLREEFSQLVQPCHLPVLCELSHDYLIDAISSDFLQACELDVLIAVIKWGEYQLVKRLEEREPNLLSHTAHSISRKGVKKRDLSDVELRDILSDILPHIRTDHVLPKDSEVLTNAIKRGLVSVPPSHMIGSDTIAVGGQSSASAWVRTRNMALFIRPRLFVPYFDEVKSLIKEQSARGQDNSVVQLHMMPPSSCAIPDALYMLDDRTCPLLHHHQLLQQQQQAGPSQTATVDIIAGTIPVPDREVIGAMREREMELCHSKLFQRAYSLLCADRANIIHHVQLRVVREFGLPDSTVQVLQSSAAGVLSPPADHRQSSGASACHDLAVTVGTGSGTCRLMTVGGVPSNRHWQHVLVQSHHCPLDAGRHSPLVAPIGQRLPFELQDDADCSSSLDASAPLIRNAMPDIAMASAAIARVSVSQSDDDDLEPTVALPFPDLDLGDGANHMMCSSGGGATCMHR